MTEAVARRGPAGAAPAGDGGAARRRRAALAALVAASAALFAAYSLLRLRAFRAGTYDLVIFDQAVRSYSRLDPPVAVVKGVHNGFGPHFAVLGDHFSPILALLAPLYRIHDGPGTLLVAQAVLFALAIPPVWRFTERRLGAAAAYLTAAVYGLSWPVAEALAFDFHEVAFVPPLSALMIERHDAGRPRQAASAAGALLFVKEDMGLLLAGFGLYLLTRPDGRERRSPRDLLPRGDRRAGLVYLAAGPLATWLASRVLIPAFGGDRDYYWAYTALGHDLPHAAGHALTHPWEAAALLATPSTKLLTLALLVLPLLLLPPASPMVLIAVPLLAERMLASEFPNWWEPRHHYNAFIIAVLVMAAVDAAARLRGGIRLLRRVPPLAPAAGMLAATLATVPFFAYREVADPGLWRPDERARAAAAAVSTVPGGVLVEAANGVGPALTSRTRVLLWDDEPRGAPWIVARVGHLEFPFTSVDDQYRRVREAKAAGYREIFRRDGYVVLHKDVPDPW